MLHFPFFSTYKMISKCNDGPYSVKMLTSAFLLLVAVTVAHSGVVVDPMANPEAVDQRIVGGEYARIEWIPYIAQIYYFKTFICGGSIVHPRFIISAAHCFHEYVLSRQFLLIDHYNDMILIINYHSQYSCLYRRFSRGCSEQNLLE